ncbi:ATP-grasp fold amidoligase family protein [Segatella copri]
MLCIHIAEEKKECVLTDYKFFCFGGEPFMMYVSQDHAEHATTDFFDMDYNLLPIRMRDPNSENPPTCPKEFEEMKQYARMLSQNIPHLRVDFYVINHHVYFGELTFYHNAGFSLVKPHEWNVKLGNLIKLKS